jgi:hypothetical protein
MLLLHENNACLQSSLSKILHTIIFISLADRLPALNLPSEMVLVSTEVVTRSVMRHCQKPGCALAIFMRVL